MAAPPEALRQEDSRVRQAIEEVLARVDLADCQDISQAETKQHDNQQAAERHGSCVSMQQGLNELSLGGA